MSSPQPPTWDTRPARLTTADLPCGCDECGELVGITEAGQPVDGLVLADPERDYVFCTKHAADAQHANPYARTVRLADPTVELPNPNPGLPNMP